jgi:hypothetical protein
VPYAGIGLLDIGWAGAAGGSIALAVLRWRDYGTIRRLPMPPSTSLPKSAPELIVQRVAPMLGAAVAAVASHPRRVVVPRRSAARPAARRLNRAAKTLPALLSRLGPHAGDTAREAAGAHAALRDLALRVAMVEKALQVAPRESREALQAARAELLDQLTDGVAAYEGLTGAAGECVAALTRGGDGLAVTRLTEATDALAGLAQGLAELRHRNAAYGVS